MRANKRLLAFVVSVLLLTASSTTSAQSEQGQNARVFGQGQPQSVQDLPPGQLKKRLESLPAKSRGRALKWLQDFSFPEADLETLQIDDEGNVFYGDTLLPDLKRMENAESAAEPVTESASQSTLDDAFLLHSNPGAPNVVYIDFDGATITGTAWNGTYSTLLAKPYNPNVDSGQPDSAECMVASTFCDRERTAIVDIWHRVSEDLASFDIDVTTERPLVFNRYTGTILVTHSIDENGNAINCTSCGGVAYVNVFGVSNYHTTYSPALVFFDKLGNGTSTYNAEASSHEFGHNLGLSHDGAAGTTYYAGQGSGLVSWAPIMGNSYYNNVTQWNNGDYAGATQLQNDLDIIDGKLGYVTDDHGNSTGSATALHINEFGQVVSSNPELDPYNVLTENKGVINSASDVDVFSFVSGAGTVNLTATPSWDAFYNGTSRRGSNLDIEMQLQDLIGNPILTAEPTTNTNASINTTVSAGTYHLQITGVGNGDPQQSGYSDYNSMGQYFINGSVPLANPDEIAPTPNPMTWASVPVATGQFSIAMTASTATDETSAVQYSFFCTASTDTNCGSIGSGWQSSSSYTATGLLGNTPYTFQARARDQAGNETASSVSASATTDAPPPPPATPTGLAAIAVSETEIDLSWNDVASTETGYRVERSLAGQNNFASIATPGANANSYSDSGLTASTTYDYRVYAVNGTVDSGYDEASGTTDAPPPLPPFVNYTASSETLVAGSVSGALSNTFSANGNSQSITERQSGGRPANRHSYLEHRWNFNIAAGDTVTVNLTARSGGSTDGDVFEFEYSLNGAGFQPLPLLTIFSTSYANRSDSMPSGSSGSVVIRVVDSDQTSTHREENTVEVDHLFIQVGSPSSEPPDGNPSGLSASMASSSQINLSWVDGTANESGFIVERSLTDPDGLSTPVWVQRADRPAGSTSYSDIGLTDETTYYYRVHAYNINGVSAFTNFANATTDVAPALSLSASGGKVKGVKHVYLGWSGSTNVDIYRNGGASPIATDWSGTTYDDNLNSKGSGTYTHKVCVAGTNTCSNTTTTPF